ncbi:MAG TPA: PAS domain S-box protein [Verrucomicrobiae bacterium]|jgi:PAS domain S-box-containing protein
MPLHFGIAAGWNSTNSMELAGAVCLLGVASLVWVLLLKSQGRRHALRMQAQLARERILSELGRKLATALNVEEAARTIADAASELFGWDAFYLNLYSAERDLMEPVINIDTIDGQRVDVESGYVSGKPTAMAREIVQHGAKLLLREEAPAPDGPSLVPFGNKSRPSASLMFVPLRDSSRIIGILSVQSYTARFYDEAKLKSLQAAADHCGGALERIRTGQELQEAHDELESRVAERTAELTEANLRLRKLEEEARIIFNSVPAAITYKDKNNRILRVNKFRAELVGLPATDIEGHMVSELSPRFADQYFREDMEIINSGQPKLGFIQLLQRANGELRWLQTDKVPYQDAEGNVAGVIAFSLDITERRKAEDALLKAREELERKIKERTAQLSEAVARLEREIAERRQAENRARQLSHLGQQLSAANSSTTAAQAVLDLADQLLGWDAAYLQLYTPDYRYTVPILLYDVVDGKRTQVFGLYREVTPRDKRIIEHGAEWVQGPASPTQPAFVSFGVCSQPTASRLFTPIRSGSKVIGCLSVQSYTEHAYKQDDLAVLQTLADFSSATLERIQAQESLRRSEERFSQAFRSSPMPMSLSTFEQGIYLDVNESMLRLFGYKRGEMLGQTALKLGIWPDPELRLRMLQELRDSKSVRDFSCRLRTKDGVLRDVLLSVECLDFSGDPVILVIVHDMTERLNLEAQLRHSQKMEAVGQLAAGVAHDFNNILTIIQGHAGLILSESNFSEDMRASLTQITGAAGQAATLTKQLLTFSRKQVMQLRHVDLNEVVRGAAQMLHRLLGETITLKLECGSAPLPIYADAGMIEQIIVNMALNARDAMPHGGRLAVKTGTVEIDAAYAQQRPDARCGDFACLAVADTGTGMSKATVNRIFEPFFTTKEVGKGTGLGLATAYAIVKHHQGWIEVASEIGQGSVFKTILPLSQAPAASEEAARPAKTSPGGHETILVVEDDLNLRELVSSLLRHYGYRVLQASHGKEALEVWRTQSDEIDLLLTDMMMPEGISGWELAEQLQAQRPELKVVYSSGYSVDLLGRNGQFGRGIHFLPKPYQPHVLAKTVRDCLDG